MTTDRDTNYTDTVYLATGDGYRYGFNGKERDDEWNGVGNMYDYGFRIYDPRIAKFLSVDPLFQSYPWYTPYQFAGNMPIWAIDLDGLEEYIVINKIGRDGNTFKTVIRTISDEKGNLIDQNVSRNKGFRKKRRLTKENVLVINIHHNGKVKFDEASTLNDQQQFIYDTKRFITGAGKLDNYGIESHPNLIPNAKYHGIYGSTSFKYPEAKLPPSEHRKLLPIGNIRQNLKGGVVNVAPPKTFKPGFKFSSTSGSKMHYEAFKNWISGLKSPLDKIKQAQWAINEPNSLSDDKKAKVIGELEEILTIKGVDPSDITYFGSNGSNYSISGVEEHKPKP